MNYSDQNSSNSCDNHSPDCWEDEYALFCSCNDNYECDDDPAGYVISHYREDASQINAERSALELMGFLAEMRGCEIQEWSFRYRIDNVPEVIVKFFDHDRGRYGEGRHIFPTQPHHCA